MRRSGAASADDARSTREVILDVAERRFAERGFRGASMRAIAAEAGLRNQASLYHHFPGKRALYEAVLARGVEPILASIAAAARAPRDEILDQVVDALVAHPHLPRLIQRAGLDDGRHLGEVVTRLLRPLWTEGLQALAGKGRAWRPADLPHLAAGLYHLIFGHFASAALLGAVLGEDPESPAAVARHRRFVKTAVGRLLGPDLRRLERPSRRSPR
jgi:AcrR family transcriptional regulator